MWLNRLYRFEWNIHTDILLSKTLSGETRDLSTIISQPTTRPAPDDLSNQSYNDLQRFKLVICSLDDHDDMMLCLFGCLNTALRWDGRDCRRSKGKRRFSWVSFADARGVRLQGTFSTSRR